MVRVNGRALRRAALLAFGAALTHSYSLHGHTAF
jgi:hypothetical protein